MEALRGKSVFITGATSGIGLETARLLVGAGARVTLHGRSEDKLCAAQESLGGDTQTLCADFASLEEVRALVERVPAGLDVLVNNAGVGYGADRHKRQLSRDNYELIWAVNYLAPFALCEWLIKAGNTPSAIVNVASAGQMALDFRDLGSRMAYDGMVAYSRSKLALITWTQKLAVRGYHAVALHPGTFLDTGMVREAKITPQGTASSGAEAVCLAAIAALSGEHDGAYYDVTRETKALGPAYDETSQRKLQHDSAATIARFNRGLAVT